MLSVSKVIADEILAIFREVLDGPLGVNDKVNFNTLGKNKSRLYDECLTRLEASDDIVVDLLVNNYVVFVESGRRAGARKPPFQAIYDWAKRKGLSTSNSFIWSVIQSIVNDGISPRPVISKMFEVIDKRWDDSWSDQIFDEITKVLDDLFK